jgi:hypothetical protein
MSEETFDNFSEHDSGELTPDVEIFGNYCEFLDAIEELDDFLKDFEKHISETGTALGKSITERQMKEKLHYEDPELLRYYRFSTTHGIIFRESFIISLGILTEKTVKMISTTYRKGHNLKLKLTDLSGSSYLEQFKMYFTKVYHAGFPFDESIWVDLKNVIIIRNCLVHKAGIFEDYETEKILDFYRRKSKINMTDINVIMTDEDFCKTCLNIVSLFFQQVFKKASKEFDRDGQDSLIP